MDDHASNSAPSHDEIATDASSNPIEMPTPNSDGPSEAHTPSPISLPPTLTTRSTLLPPRPPHSHAPAPTQTLTEPSEPGTQITDVEGRGTKRKGREPKHTSEVWEYFIRLPIEETNWEHFAACKYCHTKYKVDPNRHGTNSMLRHISRCKKNPHKAAKDEKQAMLTMFSSGTSRQGRSLVSHLYDEKLCRRVLAEFIVCAEQPFRIVEKPVFKKLLNVLEPRFPIPSRRTIGRDVWQLYSGEVKVLKKFLNQSAKRVCLTTDCWTSSQNFNYLCLTAHFIDDDWKLHKRIMNFVMIENHRGDTIGRAIEQCLLDWGIEKVFTLTADNASANDSALGYLKRRLRSWKGLVCDGDYLQLRCSAHVLNLVVNEGIREMKDSFEAIRNAIRYVRSSPSRFLKFKTWAEVEKIDTKSLVCLDVTTRWNSTYLMLESAIKFQKVFDRMCDEDADYISFFSSSSRRERVASSSATTRHDQDKFYGPVITDWDNARIFIKFLKVFYDITLKFSSSLYVTSHECFHQIARVQKMLRKNIVNNANAFLSEMSTSMQVKFDKYWGQATNMNPLLFVAVILDPRYKLAYVNHMFDVLFIDPEVCSMMKERVKDCLYRLFDEYSVGVSIDSGNASTSAEGTTSLPSFDDDDVDEEDPGHKWLESMKIRTSTDPITELDRYIATDSRDDIPCQSEFDILSWWKANSEKYKILSHMARDILAMPVSTVASESAFSTGGRVVDHYRSSLSPKMTEALICSQNWLQARQSISEIVDKLREFDNFDETENVIQFANATHGVGGEDVMDSGE